jgi:glycogen debranching enzyme
VWPWLFGPYIDAWLRVHPGRFDEARQLLAAFGDHLSEACVGSISEIFDATQPFAPRGCIAQAWSVAEVLRCFVEVGHQPARGLGHTAARRAEPHMAPVVGSRVS